MALFCEPEIEEQPEFGLQTEDAKRRLVELHFLFELRAARDRSPECRWSVGDPFDQRLDISFARSGGFILKFVS